MEDDNPYVSSARVDDLNIQDVGLREDEVEDDFVSSSAEPEFFKDFVESNPVVRKLDNEPRGELTSSTADASIYDDS